MKCFSVSLLLGITLSVCAQSVKWAQPLNSANPHSVAGRMAMDDSSNVYVSYHNQPNLSNLTQVFGNFQTQLVKFDSLGNQMWSQTISGVTSITGIRYYNNSLYLTLFTNDSVKLGPNYYKRSVLASLDRQGNVNWATSYTANLSTRFSQLYIAHNQIYVSGSGNGGGMLLTYNLNGQQLATKNLNQLFAISDIAVDNQKGVYLTGTSDEYTSIGSFQFPSPPWGGSYVSYLVKLDSSWSVDWVKTNNYFTFNHNGRVLQRNDTIYYFHVSDSSSTRDLKLQLFLPNGNLAGEQKVLRNLAFQYHDNISVGFLPVGSQMRLGVLGQVHSSNPVVLTIFRNDLSVFRRDSIRPARLNHSVLSSGSTSYAMSFSSNDSLFYNNQFQLALSSSIYNYPGTCLYIEEQKPSAGFVYNDSIVCRYNTLALQDISLHGPVQWKWEISPPYYTHLPGFADTMSVFKVQLDSILKYSIKLIVRNDLGTDSIMQKNAVRAVSQDSFALSYNNGILTGPGSKSGFQWFQNDSLLAGDTSYSFIPKENESYTLKIRSGPCVAWSFPYVVSDIGLAENKKISFKIFPNPARDFIQVRSSHMSGSAIEFNLWMLDGRLVFSDVFYGNAAYKVPLPDLPRGLYTLELRQESTRHQVLLAIE